jgi:chromosome segregation ATPase
MHTSTDSLLVHSCSSTHVLHTTDDSEVSQLKRRVGALERALETASHSVRNLKAVKSELEGQLDKATADEKKAADVAQGMYKVLKCAST